MRLLVVRVAGPVRRLPPLVAARPSRAVSSPRGPPSPPAVSSPRALPSPRAVLSPRAPPSPPAVSSPRGPPSPRAVSSPRDPPSPRAVSSPHSSPSPLPASSPSRGVPRAVSAVRGVMGWCPRVGEAGVGDSASPLSSLSLQRLVLKGRGGEGVAGSAATPCCRPPSPSPCCSCSRGGGDGEEGVAETGEGGAGDGVADMTTAAVVMPSAAAAVEDKGEEGDAAADEGDEDNPWKMDEDDVPLFRRRVKHRVDVAARKESGRFTAAEKGKQKVDEGPSRWRFMAAEKASIRRWVGQRVAGVYKGAASSRKRMHGAGRHPHYPDMEEALYRHICVHRAKGVPISVLDTQKWSRAWMKKHHKGKEWAASSHWSQRFSDRTKVGQKLSNGVVVQAQVNGWMDEDAVGAWLRGEILPYFNPVKGAAAKRSMLVLDSYRGHITPGMLAAYRTHSITPAIIPAECTSQIQPLDVSINRCFKAGVRARYCR
ncbi:unnamed protein product [Closterium sp. Naga37s-1]|nr:unnamed protein product [Closterium sp. Naga37s-1]